MMVPFLLPRRWDKRRFLLHLCIQKAVNKASPKENKISVIGAFLVYYMVIIIL